ncbi:MAG: hypothetical protein K8R68_07020, partial [Bacteroidales bacterium]|nr:hypothetical protein [Bacteroidales bacterium]
NKARISPDLKTLDIICEGNYSSQLFLICKPKTIIKCNCNSISNCLQPLTDKDIGLIILKF